MLVGLGGCGKKSIARLAIFLAGLRLVGNTGGGTTIGGNTSGGNTGGGTTIGDNTGGGNTGGGNTGGGNTGVGNTGGGNTGGGLRLVEGVPTPVGVAVQGVVAVFRAAVRGLYHSAGLCGERIAWVLSESDLGDERLLSDVASLLSSGRVAELHTKKEEDGVVAAIRPEVKAAGLVDSREQCWIYFLDKVHNYTYIYIYRSINRYREG